MGYRISSLAHLPNMELYIFVIYKHHWKGGLSDAIEHNFNKLSQQIAPNAAIVVGHEGKDFGSEIWGSIHQRPGMEDLAQHCDSKYPGMLIVGAHPNEVTPDDLILFIPLDHLEKNFNGFDAFFDALCKFTQNYNEDFIRRFEDKTDYVGEALEVVDLKPNFFGLGFNINAFINKLRNKLRNNK